MTFSWAVLSPSSHSKQVLLDIMWNNVPQWVKDADKPNTKFSASMYSITPPSWTAKLLIGDVAWWGGMAANSNLEQTHSGISCVQVWYLRSIDYDGSRSRSQSVFRSQ